MFSEISRNQAESMAPCTNYDEFDANYVCYNDENSYWVLHVKFGATKNVVLNYDITKVGVCPEEEMQEQIIKLFAALASPEEERKFYAELAKETSVDFSLNQEDIESLRKMRKVSPILEVFFSEQDAKEKEQREIDKKFKKYCNRRTLWESRIFTAFTILVTTVVMLLVLWIYTVR